MLTHRHLVGAALLTWVYAASYTSAAGIEDVCQWETFEAKCQEDEVILVKEAHYGRMRVGRCLLRNYFVGCKADVTAIMHARCSGKRYCSIPIPDGAMFAAQPCPRDLGAYLEVDYECVKVAPSNAQDCDDQILTSREGFISMPKTKSNSQKHVCPHRILAQPGQTVNVYLYDFVSHSEANAVGAHECITYGYVMEDGAEPTKICGGEFKKNHLIYTSDSNVVAITLSETINHPHHYLLKYEVEGCPMLLPPANAKVEVRERTVIVTCNNTNIAVSLVCAGNKWVGELQNCTEPDLPVASMSSTSFSDLFANTGLFLVVTVGLSLGVLFGVGLLTLAMGCRTKRNKGQQVADLVQTSLLEKPEAFMDEPISDKSANLDYAQLPADQCQPVYVPITLNQCGQYVPIRPNNMYETPQSAGLSSLYAPRITMTTFGDYATALDARRIANENPYGLIGAERTNNIYSLAALSHTLGQDKIASIEDPAPV